MSSAPSDQLTRFPTDLRDTQAPLPSLSAGVPSAIGNNSVPHPASNHGWVFGAVHFGHHSGSKPYNIEGNAGQVDATDAKAASATASAPFPPPIRPSLASVGNVLALPASSSYPLPDPAPASHGSSSTRPHSIFAHPQPHAAPPAQNLRPSWPLVTIPVHSTTSVPTVQCAWHQYQGPRPTPTSAPGLDTARTVVLPGGLAVATLAPHACEVDPSSRALGKRKAREGEEVVEGTFERQKRRLKQHSDSDRLTVLEKLQRGYHDHHCDFCNET
jgi:hypothetical protein